MAETIPHAVLSEQLEKQIGDRRLLAAVFLTFEFDPGFFEQEILPVILNVPISHASSIRLVQLEDALRSCAGRVAVYYDADHLIQGDAGSAHLDVQRIPVRHRTGFVFHPKNVLLLIEDEDKEGNKFRSLLVGAFSANLTRSGWWENVEAAHFEEVLEGESTRLKEDLQDLLANLKTRTVMGMEHDALEDIRGFLRSVDQRIKRVSQGTFQPHFYNGTESFPDFLDRCAGKLLRGSYMEVISPYVDDAANCEPLEELIRRFELKNVRILVPRSRKDEAACNKIFYDSVRHLPNVSWAKFRSEDAKLHVGGSGTRRFVHAKLYRFFTKNPKSELCFVGSVNLTTAAHRKGGNWETGLLVEVDCPRMPDFWLVPETTVPPDDNFQPQDETESNKSVGTPLMLRYHWDRKVAEVFWAGNEKSPVLKLVGRGIALGTLEPLKARCWIKLDEDWANRVADMLKETSFVSVHGHGDRPGLLLVQEVGMSHKPSLLLQLSVADILRYWAMLTPAQRAAFIEARAPTEAITGDGAELLARFKLSETTESFFDRFAGYFHSFNCLERDVREQLTIKRDSAADYRLFGNKYDSLGTLLEKTADDNTTTDDVNRYVIFLCARQLCKGLARDFPEYWHAKRKDVEVLEKTLDVSKIIRERLAASTTESFGFLDWFDAWFLKRAEPMEAE